MPSLIFYTLFPPTKAPRISTEKICSEARSYCSCSAFAPVAKIHLSSSDTPSMRCFSARLQRGEVIKYKRSKTAFLRASPIKLSVKVFPQGRKGMNFCGKEKRDGAQLPQKEGETGSQASIACE